MIARYLKKVIEKIWSDRSKVERWDKDELAVIEAKTRVGERKIASNVLNRISAILAEHPVDLQWWYDRDNAIHHDLQAYVEERRRHLQEVDPELAEPFHDDGMTSFDTEETATVSMIEDSLKEVFPLITKLKEIIAASARRHRFTVMRSRSHGVGGDLKTFGARCLGWHHDLTLAEENLAYTALRLQYSKISGAFGNYTGIDPKIEAEALRILGRKPYYGATQVLPRILFVEISDSLASLVLQLHKISLDVRLGARGPYPICQEPFKAIQKGSSAMPDKRNPIRSEQTEGMARMALAISMALKMNISTHEERAIEQSCVERVMWPDLFHITVHALETTCTVQSGLKVYPDNMLWEIVQSRGCYAASTAKDELKKMGREFGITADDAYRIIQLAAANTMLNNVPDESLRANPPQSFEQAGDAYSKMSGRFTSKPGSLITIREIIQDGLLEASPDLAATRDEVVEWNQKLTKIFDVQQNLNRWEEVFTFQYLLRNEHVLYEKILGA